MEAPWSFGPASIAAFIVFIGALIFVHELGHFLVAKYFKIKVLKFSLGFGPPLVSFRRGETTYQVAAVPLGGFVKMAGDNPMDEVAPEDRARSFAGAPLYQRALIALAGPAFNLAFPILCFFAYNLLGPMVVSPVVGQIEAGMPAEAAGLQVGDRVLTVDGEDVYGFSHSTSGVLGMADLIGARPGEPVHLTVKRGEAVVGIDVVPQPVTGEDMFGAPKTEGKIGVIPNRTGTRLGVDRPERNVAGFVTGDRVLSVDGQRVSLWTELEAALRAAKGRTVEVVVARPSPLAAGDVLYARADVPARLQVAVPDDLQGLSELGIAPSTMFIRAVVPGGAADRAGLRPGDRILALDGEKVTLFWSVLSTLANARDERVEILVRRDGQELALGHVNDSFERVHEVTRKPRRYYDPGLGIGEIPRPPQMAHWAATVPAAREKVRLPLLKAATISVRQTVAVIELVAVGLYKLLTRELSMDNVGGPIQLFKLAAQAAEVGVFAYLQTLAVISVNLGLINLLPIPILDGGHLLFVGIEAIKRKPVSLRARELASIIGLALLAMLIVLALHNDIKSLGVF